MSDQTRGLYDKYDVWRTDGSSSVGEKHEHCRYFVLDLDHDPLAEPAVRAYARAAYKAGYGPLARDLIVIADELAARQLTK